METAHINWKNIHAIHFVGIKGVAMTALAIWAKESGFLVTGSDTIESFPTDELLSTSNIEVMEGFSPDHVTGDLLIYTGAHGGRENPEVVAAEKKGLLVLPHGKALGEVMRTKRRISVAGCHGKTTTTAMIATIVANAGMDPSYAIGSGLVRGLGYSGHAGNGKWFIAEADEYATDPLNDLTPRFLWHNPELLVITNIEFDHPDIYKNIDEVKVAYRRLVNSTQGKRIVVVNVDDPNSREFVNFDGIQSQSFGFSKEANYRIVLSAVTPGKNYFTLQNQGKAYGPFPLNVPGKQNVANAAAAIIACFDIGISWQDCIVGLDRFYGVKRRFELLGTYRKANCYDDYAHHPTEISATIAAASQWYPDSQLFVLFQPHTFSRTQALITEFGKAFGKRTKVIILPIYASAREKEKIIDAHILVDEIRKENKSVQYCDSLPDAFKTLSQEVMANDVVIFMGAGDIGRLARQYITP